MNNDKKTVLQLIGKAKERGPIGESTLISTLDGKTNKQKIWFTDKELEKISTFSLDPEIALTLIELGEDNYEIVDKSFQDDPEFLSASIDVNRAITSKLSARKMEETKRFMLEHKSDYIEFVGSESRARDNFEYLNSEMQREKTRVSNQKKRINAYLKQFSMVAKKPNEMNRF